MHLNEEDGPSLLAQFCQLAFWLLPEFCIHLWDYGIKGRETLSKSTASNSFSS